MTAFRRLALFLLLLIGLVSPASAQTLSDDASLSGLSLSAGRLSPAFDGSVTVYTAGVGYTVTVLTITATKNNSSATIAYLDGEDLPLVDADTVAEGQQVGLLVGDNIVKVKVTAQDTTTTETYAVTVTRTAEDTSLSPAEDDPGTAFASTADYTVTFQGAWTSTVTPGGVPAGAHFSRLVGGVHNGAVALLESGGMSSAGVEAMAELGGWTGLRDEVLAAAPDALSSLSGVTDSISATGSESLTATLTTEHPRVTLVTMIAPSPDWFVGVSGLLLLDSAGLWLRSHEVSLYPWDAGTEEGTAFSLGPNAETDPQGTIESVRGTGLFTTEPIATLSFTLQSVSTTRQVPENTATGTDIGKPVTAAGTSGTVTYTLSGTDAASFGIVASTGQLQTNAALDYESASDSDQDNMYEVTVNDGFTDTAVTVEVTNVAELLEVSGPGSVPHAENDAGRVGSYTASSAQDRDGIVWSLSGDDAAHFSIDDPGGVLRFHIDPVSPNLFAKPPDFESASDSDQDNMYEVTVTASTTGSSTEETMNVTVEVTDVDEAGTLTLSATRPLLGTELTTTLIDPDGVVGTPTYTWERSIRPNAWKTIDGETSDSYTPAAADTGTFLRATASYEDRHGAHKTAAALTYEVVTASLLSGLSATTNDSSANPDRALSPAFSADVLHYAVGCAAHGDTMTVTPTAASDVRIAVNGTHTASGTAATVTVSKESDVHVTLTTADGAATTYVVHCLVGNLWQVEVSKTAGAEGIIEDLILIRLGGSTISMLDNNAVPRFHRDVGQQVWNYFRVDRVQAATSQAGEEPEYRYSYYINVDDEEKYVVLDQALEPIDTATRVAPLMSVTDPHDFRVLENGNYVLITYERSDRDLSHLTFEHPDIAANQPQKLRDAAVQIVTPAGQAVFTWNSWGFMPLEDCTQHRFTGLEAEADHHSYAHLNSLQMSGGLVIASMRGCSKVLAIDPDHTKDHKVAWRVGRSNLTAEQWEALDIGPAPLTPVGDPAGEFCAQHAAQVLPNGNLLLFDNGVHCLLNPWTGEFVSRTDADYYSRAVEYTLDFDNGEAVFVRDHSLHGDRQAIGNSHGQAEPTTNGDWLISWGRERRGGPDAERPDEQVTQVDPDTGQEKFSLTFPSPTFRAVPAHPVVLFAVPAPLEATFPVSSHTSQAHTGTTDQPKVVVAFNQPVVDPAAATASVNAMGATVTGVSPHLVAGEAANAYIFTLTPTGLGAITVSLEAGQACDSGGVCTADGRTLSVVPAAHVIAGTPQFPADESGTRRVDENTAPRQGIGDPVTAADPDGASLTYTLGGADAASFGIVASTGQLQTEAALDYETRPSYTVEVTATNPSGASASITVSIEVDDVNEAATVFGQTYIDYAEGGTDPVGSYSATDPEGETVTWASLAGTDAADFELSDTGVLTFAEVPDREDPDDFNGDNVYSVTVRAWDQNSYGTLDVTVTVTNVNESAVISGDTSADYAERRTDPVGFYSATDPEGSPVTLSLAGTDAADFELSAGGVLTFRQIPDYESSADSNRDNVYVVTVRAWDGNSYGTLDVAVTVTNVDEDGTVGLSSVQPQVGTELEADLSDPDGSVSALVWRWERSTTSGDPWSTIAGAARSVYTPADADLNYDLRATAFYDDGEGSAKTADAVSDNPVQPAPSMNTAPAFPTSETGQREVEENTPAGRDIGEPVAAEDDDVGDILTYTLEGADAAVFELDGLSSGQLRTKDALDYEGDRSYSMTLTATDTSGEDDSITVRVSVTNIDEPPDLRGPVAVDYEEKETGPVASYTAVDPERATIGWTLAGTDQDDFAVSSRGVLTFSAVPDYETPTDSGGDNTYEVTVRASDGTNSPTEAVTVRVTNLDEEGTITLETTDVRPQLGAVVEATLEDPDGGIRNRVWGWARSTNRRDWTPIGGTNTASYTPTSADVGHYLQATVTYDDGEGSTKAASAHTTRTVTDPTLPPPSPPPSGSGNGGSGGGGGGGGVTSGGGGFGGGGGGPAQDPGAPEFSEGSRAIRSVGEHTEPGTDIGGPLTAVDPDGDPLTYTLGGTHADLFDLDTSTGQLLTKSALDYETRNSYTLSVSVRDSKDPEGEPDRRRDDSIRVTILVTNQDDPGVITPSAPTPRVDEPFSAALADPDGGVTDLAWQWDRSPDKATWTPIDGATTNVYTPTADDQDRHLRVTATYTDTLGGNKTATRAADAAVTTGVATEFGDIEADGVHTPAIEALAEQGVFADTECGPNLFCPHQPMQRWVMAVWLIRLLTEEPPAIGASRFGDIADGQWWIRYTEQLADLEITVGCTTNPPQYCPNGSVTRAQMATLLVRALKLDPAAPAGFTDTEGNTHAANIDTLFAAGITVGCDTDPLRYCPNQPVTRAQMASFLHRALEYQPPT